MELLGLLGLLLVVYWLVAPAWAWLRASAAREQIEVLEIRIAGQEQQIELLRMRLRALELGSPLDPPHAGEEATPSAPARQPEASARAEVGAAAATAPVEPPQATVAAEALPVPADQSHIAGREGFAQQAGDTRHAPDVDGRETAAREALTSRAEAASLPSLLPAETPLPVHTQEAAVPAAETAQPVTPAAPIATAPPRPAAARVPASERIDSSWVETATPAARETGAAGRGAGRDRDRPGLFALAFSAARDWLFGGNLVARLGLVILFIGVAFLLRFASAYVVVPIELRLAGIAAGAIGLLVWGWHIRLRRPGIALPVQGAALATLMLVVFGAFKLYELLPAGAAFGVLVLLVAFTCILALLQDALWLATFGIVGGFAVPVLTSTGEGSHVALFSYYALLNAGILALAWRRAWRMLHVLGFVFTFLVASAWGVLRYEPAHYASAQSFLAIYLLFYLAIAILYAWRQAPELKSYVDATLVFGVPTVAMALQYGMVRDMELGPALSSLALGLLYAASAAALWRWRSGSLRLLVESFLSIAVVFGTLAIPFALDARWTSAAWALQGAGMVWIGLRQGQRLVWGFGILLQLLAWAAFVNGMTGLDLAGLLQGRISLGFLLLGGVGLFLALELRRRAQADTEAGTGTSFLGTLAAAFIAIAVCWLLGGLWLEVWLRVHGVHRAGMLVLTAIGLGLALQWLGKRLAWRLPQALAGVLTALASVVFLLLMAAHLRLYDIVVYPEQSLGEILANSGLLGALLLSGGALVSALAFRRRWAETAASDGEARAAAARACTGWLLLAVFWSCLFALPGAAHVLGWLSSGAAEEPAPWYRVSFWSAFAVGLGLAAWGWTALASRLHFPHRGWMLTLFWPGLTTLAGLILLVSSLPRLALGQGLEFHWAIGAVGDGSAGDAFKALLGGPLLPGLVLSVLAWVALQRMSRAGHGDQLSAEQVQRAQAWWLLGLGALLYALPLDVLAQFAARLLGAVGGVDGEGLPWLGYADWRLLGIAACGALALRVVGRGGAASLRWLGPASAAWFGLAWLVLLLQAWDFGRAPRPGTLLALTGAWLAQWWWLRAWLRQWPLSPAALMALHGNRVIGPWLLLAPTLSFYLAQWLALPETVADDPWVVAGMWPDYLAAWAALALLFLGLRQVRGAGWPLAPLQDWYGRWIIPAAALWALLLALWWNLRQDGSMQPLPYLPLLNPLDLSSAFVALLWLKLWQLHRQHWQGQAPLWMLRLGAGFGFLWFNLMLLRSAAHYFDLPYRFSVLYASPFIQAMLSLVWTLCAFALMRQGARRLSRTLWLLGAALLAAVVLKLFLVDLRNVGNIARVISFMGVGGLMLLIGYLAPWPGSVDAAEKSS